LRRNIIIISCILVGLGALSGLYAGWKRHVSEGLNRRVEMAMEYADVRALAMASHDSMPDTIRQLKNAGLTSLAVTEDTYSSLETQGDLHVNRQGSRTLVTVSSASLLERIHQGLTLRGMPSVVTTHPDFSQAGTLFYYKSSALPGDTTPLYVQASSLNYSILRSEGIGLNPAEVDIVKQNGLHVLARISNFSGASYPTMLAVLQQIRAMGIRTVIFQGLEVLGFRGNEKDAASAIEDSGIHYGQVEFGKQKGDDQLSRLLRGQYIRVHSVSDAEMGTMTPNEIIERYVRAARERNIRICYLRMISWQGQDPVKTNAEFINTICQKIARKSEMEFGPAHLFASVHTPHWTWMLMGAGIAGGVVLLLLRLFAVAPRTAWWVLLLSLLVCIALSMLGEMGRKIDALFAALIFPTLACLRRDILTRDGDQPPSLSRSAAAWQAVATLAVASAITSLGIYQVVGLLASRTFMLKANQFLGIKAAHALPILAIALIAVTGLPRQDLPWKEEWEKIKRRVGKFLSEPTRVGELTIVFVALALLALIVMRTGNDPGVGVSGIELKFRALLDHWLPVRPRTKEFLVGHPAFILAMAFWYRGRRKWAIPLFIAGVIGQVSILNTFCHIHSPLHLSFIRDVSGLVIGTVIGLVVYWVIDMFLADPAADSGSGNENSTISPQVDSNG
jgi:hypothetical protein